MSTPQHSPGAVTIPKRINVPSGADPSVAAELGGAGFETIATAQGWSDGRPGVDAWYRLLQTSGAKPGGRLRIPISDFPAALRFFGVEANTATTASVTGLVYQSLIGVEVLGLGFAPSLASHWRIDPADSQTYWFRIDPDARFNDGTPVTTTDVLATWRLGLDSTILDPFQHAFEQEFEMPVAVSKYLLKVRSKTANWKNMLYFGGQSIYPAHEIGNLSGREFLRRTTRNMPIGSGPYVMLDAGYRDRQSITLTRVADWWGRGHPVNAGQYNFDTITFLFVEDAYAQLESTLEGLTDITPIENSGWWLERLNVDAVRRGLIHQRKIWNAKPAGINGLAFNMRRPPFDDPRVREAVVLLLDREEYITAVTRGERILMGSFFPGSFYENPRNPRLRRDPERARQLLAEAGYTTRNAEGILVKNDRPLIIDVPINQGDERIMERIRRDLATAGIRLTFTTVDFSEKLRMQDAREFSLVQVAYTGLVYPNPEGQFSSTFADIPNSNNLTGFKHQRVDEIIEIEKVTADPRKRIPLLRELDSILVASNAFALFWYSPFERYIAWAHIRMPEFGWSRIGDYRDAYTYWWYDPVIARQVEAARQNDRRSLPVPPVDNRYWLEWSSSDTTPPTSK